MIGIVGYGTYIPRYRLKTEDIAGVWKKDAGEILHALGVVEKSVPASDEDAVTVSLEAAASACAAAHIAPYMLEALFVGSESHPYAVNPTATIVGELLGVGHDYLASDMEFACKAGTAGMQAVAGLVSSGHVGLGMAIGADTAQSKPHDALEYTSATAAAAYLLGKTDVACELVAYTSYSSDTPDFWRRDGIRYPSHAGRFSGEPAYFAHVMGASKRMLSQTDSHPEGYDYAVFHMPNGKFPRSVAKRLGFTSEQIAPSLTVDSIGNPYSASAMLGLAAVLDQAKPGQTIFMVSYGSGAGSDAFVWKVTQRIVPLQKWRKEHGARVSDYIACKTYVSYVEYLKQTHKV